MGDGFYCSVHICRERVMFEILCTDGDQGDGTVCLKLHHGTIKKALNERYVPYT